LIEDKISMTHFVPDFGDRFLVNFPFRPRGAYMTHVINRYICWYLDVNTWLYNQLKKKFPFYS